ncbi:MAG: hypothetical protein IJG80_05740, partial [Selenomonadaceae bacterium]|nr:hypothetical protein [Selenomonadaceae bacterium]
RNFLRRAQKFLRPKFSPTSSKIFTSEIFSDELKNLFSPKFSPPRSKIFSARNFLRRAQKFFPPENFYEAFST